MRIVTLGNDKIFLNGFSKATANKIKQECSKYIQMNTQRGTTEALADAIATTVGNSKGIEGQISVADELKKLKQLLGINVITQNEYDDQKSILLNN